jgi:adenylate kinase
VLKEWILIFLGPPGSGKGTIASIARKKLKFLPLSTGNLLRQHIANQTKIGKKIDFTMKSGNLISDELVSEMVFDWMENSVPNGKSIILDGYPRTVTQVESLYKYLNEHNRIIQSLVIHFVLSDNIILDRLSRRYMCRNQKCQKIYAFDDKVEFQSICDECGSLVVRREDDTREIVQNRLNIYRKNEKELLKCVEKLGFKVHELNTNRLVEDVFNDFYSIINDKNIEV